MSVLRWSAGCSESSDNMRENQHLENTNIFSIWGLHIGLYFVVTLLDLPAAGFWAVSLRRIDRSGWNFLWVLHTLGPMGCKNLGRIGRLAVEIWAFLCSNTLWMHPASFYGSLLTWKYPFFLYLKVSYVGFYTSATLYECNMHHFMVVY